MSSRILITAAKLTAGGLIIGWLAWQAQQNDKFQQLAEGRKDWTLLALALLACGFTTALSFVRWMVVAKAAGVPLALGEAMRLGSLGYTLNFVSPGSVGGDVFKAAALAKDRPGVRTAAVTTVVVDRVLALFSFLLFATVGFLLLLARGTPMPIELRAAGWAALGLTAACPIAISLALSPSLLGARLLQWLEEIPVVGPLIAQVVTCSSEYRRGLRFLGLAMLLCLIGHVALISSFYLVARGLPLESPGWLSHAFMVPFACLSGSIPIFPAGLGAVEGTLDYFYQWFGAPAGNGAFVAFGYRLATLAVAFIAAPYYLTHQAIVKRALAEAEAAPDLA